MLLHIIASDQAERGFCHRVRLRELFEKSIGLRENLPLNSPLHIVILVTLTSLLVQNHQL